MLWRGDRDQWVNCSDYFQLTNQVFKKKVKGKDRHTTWLAGSKLAQKASENETKSD